jgi:hypothetical protein
VKLHRRVVRLDGRPYTVVTLRPGTDVRFSTNHFHDTWHLLSDWRGARLLGRLLWGLAYQRVPGTLVLIDGPFLNPNPFDAEPADPIALVPAHLTALTTAAARALRRRWYGPPDGTVRWHTHGLDAAAVAARPAPRGRLERVDRIGGLVVFTAIPRAMADFAMLVYRLGACSSFGMDYVETAGWTGEVQVFADYRHRVSAARVARREVLAEVGGGLPPAQLRPLVWQRGTEVRRRRQVRPPV